MVEEGNPTIVNCEHFMAHHSATYWPLMVVQGLVAAPCEAATNNLKVIISCLKLNYVKKY